MTLREVNWSALPHLKKWKKIRRWRTERVFWILNPSKGIVESKNLASVKTMAHMYKYIHTHTIKRFKEKGRRKTCGTQWQIDSKTDLLNRVHSVVGRQQASKQVPGTRQREAVLPAGSRRQFGGQGTAQSATPRRRTTLPIRDYTRTPVHTNTHTHTPLYKTKN